MKEVHHYEHRAGAQGIPPGLFVPSDASGVLTPTLLPMPSPLNNIAEVSPGDEAHGAMTSNFGEPPSRMGRINDYVCSVSGAPTPRLRKMIVRIMAEDLCGHDFEYVPIELGLRFRGSAIVASWFCDFCDSMPDLCLRLKHWFEHDPISGSVQYVVSGTQTKMVNPLFPVGGWVEWEVTHHYEFGTDGRICRTKSNVDFPETVTREHYAGLAQCFHMLVSTAGGSKLLERALKLNTAEHFKALLLEPLSDRIWAVSLSIHGNFVLKSIAENLSPQRLRIVCGAFRGKVFDAARHNQQSRVLECLIRRCQPHDIEPLIEEALPLASILLFDPFANFVMQAMLEHGSPEQCSALAAVICLDIDRFARHAMASHAVRKALVHGSPEDQCNLMSAIKDSPQYATLTKHKIGSFVVREMKLTLKRLRCLGQPSELQGNELTG